MINTDDEELLDFWFPEERSFEIVGRWIEESGKQIIFLLQDKNNFYTFEYWQFQTSKFGTGWQKAKGLEGGIYQTIDRAVKEIASKSHWIKNRRLEKKEN